jgi:hypothetical protein
MKTAFRAIALVSGFALTLGVSISPTAVSAEVTMKTLGQHVAEQSRLARAGWDPATGISRKAWASALADETVKVGKSGRAFVIEPRLSEAELSAATERAVPVHTGISLANALSLNSRPGSLRTIYLDVNGHDVTGTAWDDNDYFGSSGASRKIPGYNIQGKSNNYSTLERQRIVDMWSSVAEDFAMFDVNVTTQAPSQSALDRTNVFDTQFGVRVVVSNSSNKIAQWCGCGGVAWVGVFNHYPGLDLGSGPDWSSHRDYSTAFAFSQSGMTGKTLSDIVSHEVGHTLGLIHDGGVNEPGGGVEVYYLGHPGWAPIMGAGYSQPLVQWSDGTYTTANNPEDDLAVIQTFGLDPLADDHGDASNVATPLQLNVVGTGVISTRADVDSFSFVPLTNTVTVSVALPSRSPNLDVSLVITDSLGNTIATINPAFSVVSAILATGLSASSVVTVVPGDTYFAAIDGAGFGSGAEDGYSDYGSIGDYQIAVLGEAISPTGTPTISGRAKVRRWLTASVGVWMSGTTLTQQWLRNGRNITGATGTTYKLKSADRGKRISVRVNATKLGYSPATVTSLKTARVRG